MDIREEFRSIIGQERAKQMMSMSAHAGEQYREMLSLLVHGEKGNGKTNIIRAYGESLVANNPNRKLMVLQPRDFRLINETYNRLVETIISGEEYVLIIDEAHELVTDNTKQLRTIFNFIRNALDGNNRGKTIAFDSDQFTMFDRRRHVICLATNYPYLLDKSGALQSRFTEIVLDLYNEKELAKIAELMAEKAGLNFEKTEESDPLMLIARCGRGTARFLERIFEQLALFSTDTIGMNHVAIALRNLKLFPRGLNEKEIWLLKTAMVQPINKAQFLSMTGMDSDELKKSIAYLSNPETRLINQAINGTLETTKRGKLYLKKCKEVGFDI